MSAWYVVVSICVAVHADGPQDNLPDQVRPVPPTGVEVSAADREQLKRELSRLGEFIHELQASKSPRVRELLPDVQVFHRAVRVALEYDEFFSPAEIKAGHELLQVGLERAEQLANGRTPWTTQTGLVVRGYLSRLDQTPQPYGLVVPESYSGSPARLDVWLHGRGEKLSEVAFLNQRQKQVGSIAPPHTIVLHPYGRYCNAFKFAGEIDVLECLDAVRKHYRIDDDRIAIRGFSMGGAGCWQLAVHYPDLWFAANPGAGFAETPEFLRTFQQETLAPTIWERTLWRWYDCTGYAANLLNCPTIAYSGERDRQKQAADIMEQALADRGLALTHVIGPQTEHSIHPESAQEMERRLAALAVRGRDRLPSRIHFTTFTLRYNRSHWLTVNGLEKHWEPATVSAEIQRNERISVQTQNVAGFSLRIPSGYSPFDPHRSVMVEVNGQVLEGPQPETDRSWTFHWWRGAMRATDDAPYAGLRKRPGLQGPIDDAFLDRFVIVRPTGVARHALVDQWTRSELNRLVREWRRHFRGDAVVVDDSAVTEKEMESANLILFGDPSSNSLLKRIGDRLPIVWDEKQLALGGVKVDAASHAPVFIYPSPLHSQRYVVVNSGFTFREYDYLNNARQVPRLPDWSVVDLRVPADSRYPGKVAAAGFFDEQWQ
jgi:pimeloyl-ACP methyl ester carboxylesterase